MPEAVRPPGSSNAPPDATARLGRRETCADFDFFDIPAASDTFLATTRPHIADVVSGRQQETGDPNPGGPDPDSAIAAIASNEIDRTTTTSTTTTEPGTILAATASTVHEKPSSASHAWSAGPRRTTRWQTRAQFLLENADQLRRQFGSSRKALTLPTQKADKKVVFSERGLCQLVDHQLSARRATCIHFNSVTRTFTLPTVLARARHVTIKLDATGIGRERFLKEVLPAVAKINSRCPVVLVARKNGLRPADLQALVDIMKRSAVVYHLDLSDNLLCGNEAPCMPLVVLFHVVGPMSHVYLSNCGLNDATALRIASALPANPCIRHLDLRGNAIEGSGAVQLAQAAGQGSALAAVRLQGNEFDEDDEDVMRAVEAANRLRSPGPHPEDGSPVGLPVVETSAVDAVTVLHEPTRVLIQQLLDIAASREQL